MHDCHRSPPRHRPPSRRRRSCRARRRQPRLRTGRRTQQAIDALLRLRTEIALGAPHADLLERVDDALYSLKRG